VIPVVERKTAKPLKFLLAGGINTVAFYGFYVVLLRLGVPYNLALSLDYGGGIVIGYLLNRHWTFDAGGAGTRAFLKYCLSYIIIFLLNLAILNIIVKCGLLRPVFGQVLALGIVTAVSYTLQNVWVFRRTVTQCPGEFE